MVDRYRDDDEIGLTPLSPQAVLRQDVDRARTKRGQSSARETPRPSVDIRRIGDVQTSSQDQRGAGTLGVSGGLLSLRASGAGIAALAGEAVGSDRLRDWGFDRYEQIQERVSDTMRPEFEVENIESLGDALSFARYWVGYGLAQLGPTAGAGAIGSVVGRRMVARGVERYMGTKAAADRVATMEAQGMARDAAEGRVREIAQQAMNVASNQAARRGGMVGAAVPSYGQQVGATYGQAGQQAIQEGGTLDDVNVPRALGAGVAGGTLQFAGQLTQLGALGVGPGRQLLSKPFNALAGASGGSVRRGLSRGAATSVAEGVTEVGQEFTQAFGADRPTPEAKDLLTPFFAGAVGGGAVGTAGGFFGRRGLTLEEQRATREQERLSFEDRLQQEGQVTSADVTIDPQVDAVPTPGTLDPEGAQLAKSRVAPGMTQAQIEAEFVQVPSMVKRDGTLRKDAQTLAQNLAESINPADPALSGVEAPMGVGRTAWRNVIKNPQVVTATDVGGIARAVSDMPGMAKKDGSLNKRAEKIVETAALAKFSETAPDSQQTERQATAEVVGEAVNASEVELDAAIRTDEPVQGDTQPTDATPRTLNEAVLPERQQIFNVPPEAPSNPTLQLADPGTEFGLQQRSALAFAMQGFTPEYTSAKQRGRGQETSDQGAIDAVAQVESLKDILENSETVVDLLESIHAEARIRDSSLSDIARSRQSESDPEFSPQTRTDEAALPTGGPRQAAIRKREASSARLKDLFQDLEQVLGRDNLKQALAVAKNMAATAPADSSLPSQMIGSDTSEGVRFSQAYTQYLDGRLGSPFISPVYIRHSNEVALANPNVSPRIRQILNTTTTHFGSNKVSQAEALLSHVRQTSESPIARRLAGILHSMLSSRGMLVEGQIRFRLMKEERSKGSKGTGVPRVGVTRFSPKDGGYAQIDLYREGQNTVTILHELFHVASQSSVEQAAQGRGRANKAYNELAKISRSLESLDRASVVSEYGERTAAILDIVRAPDKRTRLDQLVDNVSELLSYGLTDEGFQRLLLSLDTPTSGKFAPTVSFQKRRGEIGTLWNRFVSVVKKLVGANRMSNTEFDRFMFASSELFATIAEGTGRLESPAVRRELASIGRIPPQDGDAFNPSAWMEDAAIAEAAVIAERIEQSGIAGSQRQKQQERKVAADEAAKRAADEQAARVRVAGEEIAGTRSVAATDSPAGNAQRDLVIFDRIGRNVMDAVGGFIAGVDNFDYQRWAEGQLARGGQAVQDFVAGGVQNDPAAVSALRKAVGYAQAAVIDKPGVPSMLRGMLYRLQSTVWTNDTKLRELGTQLKDLNENQQFAILEALDSGNDARMEALLNDQNELAMAKTLAAEIRALFKKGESLGLLSDLGKHPSILAYVRVASRRELGLSDQAQLRRSAANTVGKLPASERAFVKDPQISYLNLLDSNGEASPVRGIKPGLKFIKARKLDGDVYYVSPEITNGRMKELGLVPSYSTPDATYTVSKMNNSSGDATLTRPRTPDELVANNERADIMASLLLSTQALSHRIATLQFQDSMLVMNKGMDDADRWITDALPNDVPESRVIDVRGDKVPLEARMPGRWVKVPDDAKTWGDLSGMYVSGPAYAAMKDMQNTDPMGLNKLPLFAVSNRVWKKNMTTWSPVTHMNNIGGNFTLQYFHDIPSSNMKTSFEMVLHKLYPKIHRRVYKRDLPKNLRLLNEEIEAMGIQLVAHKYNELDPESANDLAQAITEWRRDGNDDASSNSAAATATALEAITGSVAKFDRTLSELYSNQDNVFRIAAYITYVQNEQSKGRAPDRSVMEEAGAYARDSFVNYRIDAPLINALRSGALGYQLPFLAWTYRAVPLVAKTAITKPWKLATITGGLHAINAMAYALVGADEEEERDLLPDFMSRNIWGVGAPMSVRLPFGDKDNAVFFHTGNMIPAGDLFAMDRSANVPTAAVPGGPMMVVLQAALNYDVFRSDDVVYDTSQTPMQDTAAFLARNGGPRLLVSAFDTGHDLVVDPSGPLGNKPNKVLNLARFMGLNMREINLDEQRLYQGMNVQRIRREYSAAINRLNREYHRRGRFQSYEKLLREQNKLMEAMQRDIEEELGVD